MLKSIVFLFFFGFVVELLFFWGGGVFNGKCAFLRNYKMKIRMKIRNIDGKK